jgi:hypothetical protein
MMAGSMLGQLSGEEVLSILEELVEQEGDSEQDALNESDSACNVEVISDPVITGLSEEGGASGVPVNTQRTSLIVMIHATLRTYQTKQIQRKISTYMKKTI